MSDQPAIAGTAYTFTADGLPVGAVGVVGMQLLYAATGAPALPRASTAVDGMVEEPVGSGIYAITRVLPPVAGLYNVVWDTGGPSPAYGSEPLQIDAPPPPPPNVPVPDAPPSGAPNGRQVRALMPNVKWTQRGYPAPVNDTDPDPLDAIAQMAADYVQETTGRALDATLPAGLVRMAQMAVALATVAFLSDFNDDQLEALSEGDVLASFSADGLSENYRDSGATGKAQREALMIHPWPPLNRLLWALLTPEKRVWWFGFLQGGGIPMWGNVEVDWSGANRWGGVPGGPGEGGLAGDELGYRGGGGVGGVVYPTGSFTGVLGADRPVG